MCGSASGGMQGVRAGPMGQPMGQPMPQMPQTNPAAINPMAHGMGGFPAGLISRGPGPGAPFAAGNVTGGSPGGNPFSMLFGGY